MNHRSHLTVLTLSTGLALGTIAFAAPGAQPTAHPLDKPPPARCSLHIPLIETQAPPGLQFDQAPWSQAACITGFLQIGGQKMSPHPTWTYLYYTRTTLWLGYRCDGVPGEKLKAEHTNRDDKTWRDDSVDLILNHTGDADKAAHVVVNSAGTTYDMLGEDTSWNPTLDIRIAKDAAGWSIVIGVPFKELGVAAPRPGTVWTANFCRNSSLPDRSCWAPVIKGYVEPERFGRIVFGGPRALAVQMRKMEPFGIGRNGVQASCPQGSTLTVIGLDRRDRPIMNQRISVSTSRGTEFKLGDDHVCRVDLAVAGTSGEVLCSGSYPVESPCVSDALRPLLGHFDQAGKMLPKFPAAARAKAEPLLAKARPSIQEAARLAESPENRSREDWRRLDSLVAQLRKELDGVLCLARTLAKHPDAEFAVGLDSPMRKVMIKDHPFDGTFDDHYELSLARNEHEGLQIAAIPFARDLADVTVTAGPLKSASGQAFDSKVEVSLVGHVDVADNPPYDAEYKGWWPDPLLSFLQKCDAKEGEHVSFWIDVATRAETKPGDYEAAVTVAAAGVKPVQIKLKVRVWDFALPDGTHLRNAFTYNEGPTSNLYKGKWNDEMRYRYYDFILDHRLNIDHLYRRESPSIDVLKYGAARGMNAFNVGGVFRKGKGDKADPKLAAYLHELKKAKLFDMAYVYGFDEIRKEKFAEMREVFGEVHKRFPGLETMTTAVDPSFGKRNGLREVVDIWVPLTDYYNLAEARQLRRQGKEMWWYICVVPTHPYANWFIEYPAIEARLLTGAMSYKYEAGGFLYYLINLWTGNHRPITQGPYADWNPGSLINEKKHYTANGDGSLLCPGPDGPLSTIRLENIRDGFEDYEYLWLLRDTASRIRKLPATTATRDWLTLADALLAVPDTVVTTTTNYTREPAELADFRTKLAEAIIEGQSLVR